MGKEGAAGKGSGKRRSVPGCLPWGGYAPLGRHWGLCSEPLKYRERLCSQLPGHPAGMVPHHLAHELQNLVLNL